MGVTNLQLGKRNDVGTHGTIPLGDARCGVEVVGAAVASINQLPPHVVVGFLAKDRAVSQLRSHRAILGQLTC